MELFFSGVFWASLSPATAAAQGPRGVREAPPGTETTVSGTISQFNYDRYAEVEGFLLNRLRFRLVLRSRSMDMQEPQSADERWWIPNH